MCIFANEGGPKSKSSRKETPLKIQKYKEKHVSGKNLEKMFSAPTPNEHGHGHEHSEHEPEEALVVKEVAAGVTTDALCVPLLVQHCQEEPASVVSALVVELPDIKERVLLNVFILS